MTTGMTSAIQTGRERGMQLLDDHLLRFFAEGKIAEEDAVDHSQNPAEMRDKVEAVRSGRLTIATRDMSGEPVTELRK